MIFEINKDFGENLNFLTIFHNFKIFEINNDFGENMNFLIFFMNFKIFEINNDFGHFPKSVKNDKPFPAGFCLSSH